MGGECFNCGRFTSERYTLILESGKIIKDKAICAECVSDFNEEDWMEVHEEPVLMRGGDNGESVEDAGNSPDAEDDGE